MKEGIKKSKEAMKKAYCPYSNFPVGAALLLSDGTYILGANVENGSFSLTSCAERNALFHAYSKGLRKKDIKKIFITANIDKPISPCGACRQVMHELMDPECDVILSCNKDEVLTMKVKDLIPYAFSL